MKARESRPIRKLERLKTYTAYSVGCAVAWALVWFIVATIDPHKTVDNVRLVFLGWVIGWTSATVARAVYPPPRQRRAFSSKSES